MRQVNFLLVTADDMNYDSPGVCGCRIQGITPNIDRLAIAGIRSEHAHVTIAVCQLSWSRLMTGKTVEFMEDQRKRAEETRARAQWIMEEAKANTATPGVVSLTGRYDENSGNWRNRFSGSERSSKADPERK
jgi:hypothetical protein